MRRSARNALLLIGCLAMIVAAGGFAVFALNRASAASPQLVTTTLRVAQNDPGGIAKLTTNAPAQLRSGQVMPAGTAVNVPSVSLASALAPAQPPAVGTTLSCALSVTWGASTHVIDLVKCTPT
ncbi:MAG TPA: hypothetical protein VGN81_10550 [Pseudonocardiaceae bacterium]|jgi:hypothetical protein